jgi:hypothetical protein
MPCSRANNLPKLRLTPSRRNRSPGEHDVVAVMRWIEGGATDGFVKRLLAALD